MTRGGFIRTSVFLSLLALSSGCFQVKDDLVIQPDGSGSVELHVRAVGGNNWRRISSYFGGNQPVLVYPPSSAAEARQFFPGTDFKLTTKTEQDKGATITRVSVTFSDVNALLASPYGQAHLLRLEIEEGQLRCRAVSGIETVARGIELEDPTGTFVTRMPEAALAAERSAMRMEFSVTLPNPIAQSNGDSTDRKATWIAERAQFENGIDYANKTGEPLEAACHAGGLTWTPKCPARLGPGRFESLRTGLVPGGNPPPETNQVLAAANFAPHTLSVTRSVDFFGEGWVQNSAQLTGAATVPAALAPSRWGDLRLVEVLDSRGNDLLPPRQRRGSSRSYGAYVGFESADPSSDRTHPVTIEFRPPDWGVSHIARIHAFLPMEYFGGMEILKFTNAIPAELIQTSDNALNEITAANFPLTDGRLAELGFEATLQAGLVQRGVTLLVLKWPGEGGLEAQVFDREGRPWPTLMQRTSDGEEALVQLIVPGQPAPPLSLGVLVSGSTRTIELPIALENLAIHGGAP